IQGRVLDEYGAPVPLAKVIAFKNGTKLMDIDEINTSAITFDWTGSDGYYYLFPLIPGSYDILVLANGKYYKWYGEELTDYFRDYINNTYIYFIMNYGYFNATKFNVQVTSYDSAPTNITFTLLDSTGNITGVVNDDTGAALSGAKVYLKLIKTDAIPLGMPKPPRYDDMFWYGTEFSTWTNPDGSWRANYLVNGTYNVTISAPGFNTTTVEAIISPKTLTTVPTVTMEVAPPGPIKILLVDDNAATGKGEGVYTEALDYYLTQSAGSSYDVWDVAAKGVPTAGDLAAYNAVVWYTGDIYNRDYSSREKALASYLDGGGRLFFSSQDFLYDMGADEFAKKYLHTLGEIGTDAGDAAVAGESGDPITGTLTAAKTLTYPSGFTDYSDEITVAGDAIKIFHGTTDDKPMALRYPNEAAVEASAYKTVFLAFPFECYTGTAGSADADSKTLMTKALDWLKIPYGNSSIISGPYIVPSWVDKTKNFTIYFNYTDVDNNVPAYLHVTIDAEEPTQKAYEVVRGLLDFSVGAGVDKWAYYGADANGAPPAITAGTEFPSDGYKAIAVSDDVNYTTGGGGANNDPYHLFKFKIALAPASITRLDVLWEGHNDAGTSRFYIWNAATAAWEELGSHTQTVVDGIIKVTKTTGIADYIDGSGYLYLCAIEISNSGKFIYTDYVKVAVGDKNYKAGAEFNFTYDPAVYGELEEGYHTFNISGADSTGITTVGMTMYYFYFWVNDTVAPVIEHTQGVGQDAPTWVDLNVPIIVNATIKENLWREEKVLHYKNVTGVWFDLELRWQLNQLKQDEPDAYWDDINQVTATIPGQTSSGVVYYYFTAKDARGTHSVRLPVGPGDFYKVNVGVIPPSVLVTLPNGGETLTAGSSYNIEWTTTNGTNTVSYTRLYYSYDDPEGDGPWIDLVNLSVGGGAQSWAWTVNDTPSTNCWVKVEAVDSEGYSGSDTSNSTFTITAAVGASPSQVRAVKAVNDINLTWEDTGATSYDVWRSPRLDGNFSYFSKIATVTGNLSAGTRWFVDGGAYEDGNNYSYVVNATGNSTKSNIAFKLCQPLETPSGMNINMVSLPYNNQYGTLVDIPTELTNTYLSKIRTWDTPSQSWKEVYWTGKTWGGDTTYVLGNKSALMLFMNAATTWKIVGSHNLSTVLKLETPGGMNINMANLPYHHKYATLVDIPTELTNTYLSKIRTWDTPSQSWKEVYWTGKTWGGDTTYALKVGDAALLFMNSAYDWVPNANNP
ncbi:MAG: carboxypeptidase-like regulatory domain-containing protein, partial [Candidatus Thermoplasmatota archaeon]